MNDEHDKIGASRGMVRLSSDFFESQKDCQFDNDDSEGGFV